MAEPDRKWRIVTNRPADAFAGKGNRRLDSWKEIAAYLSRDVRTAIRWEAERGLPVHRVPGGKRTAVFSYTQEIDAWLVSQSEAGSRRPEEPLASEDRGTLAATMPPPQPVVDPGPKSLGPGVGRPYLHAALVVAVIAGLLAVLGWRLLRSQPPPRVRGYKQLTHDGALKRSTLVTDGVKVYFNEMVEQGFLVMEIPITGGTPVPVSMAWKGLAVEDISPDGHAILAQIEGGTAWEKEFWILPLPAGQARHLGLVGGEGKWSPDGKSLAFANGDGLYLAKADGSGARRLLTVNGKVRSPHWSPDGTVLQFGIQEAQRGDVFLWQVSASGGDLHPVAGLRTDAAGFASAWTPDGRFELFAFPPGNIWAIVEKPRLFRKPVYDKFQLTNGPIPFSDPLAMHNSGRLLAIGQTERVELVEYDPVSRHFLAYLDGIPASQIAFSPDRQRVVYILAPGETVWESKVDGSERRQLTFSPLAARTPRWSPDGKNIAFAGSTGSAHGRWNIYVMPQQGGHPERLIPVDADQNHPGWSPDGRSMVFAGAPWVSGFSPESTFISIFDFATRQASILPGSQGFWSPRWSPDGHYIVAETVDSEKLMLFDVRDRKWSELTSARAIECTAWSHDGRYVYFNTNPSDLYRVPVQGGGKELVLRLEGPRAAKPFGQWFGLTPDDSLLMQRDSSISEIYALDVDWPS